VLQEALRLQEDPLGQFSVDTHLLPRTLNGIPETLPAPLDTHELWGDAPPAGPGAPGRRLDSLDVHQRRYSQAGAVLADPAGAGRQYGGGEGEGAAGAFRQLGHGAPARASGRAAARYQGEEGEEEEEDRAAGPQRQQQLGGRPGLSISTRRPPGSPAILRGDHLPSPTRPGAKPGGSRKPAATRPRVGQR
jgi:hypothetical protein